MLNWDIENEYFKLGYDIVCGCDEAGRGPLAGPVFAAAVILPAGEDIDGLDDSKKLSAAKRQTLCAVIKERACAYAVARAEVEEIEEVNILNASMLAMRRAVECLHPSPKLALIDGNVARGFDIKAVPIIKGDAKSPSIAAASILAKVARDGFCLEMDALYPQYGFAKHKGYGTREHRAALLKFGPCPLHRGSFLKKIMGGSN